MRMRQSVWMQPGQGGRTEFFGPSLPTIGELTYTHLSRFVLVSRARTHTSGAYIVSFWSQIKIFPPIIYIVTTPEVTIPHRTKTSNQRARDSYLSVYYILLC